MENIIQYKKLIGHVAVDSGQLMVCDPCYIEREWEFIDEFAPSGGSDNGTYPFDYNGACGATMSEEMAGQLDFSAGHLGVGVAFASGFGDGLYPVYATYIDHPIWGKRIAKVEIVCVDTTNDESEEL